MPAIFGLFNLISLLYILRSLQLTAVIWRERQALRQPPLSHRQKHLAEQASFFIAVPIGVLLHELGHALAVWGFGGEVVEFGYRAFWGYVIPRGSFTPFQVWFIGLAGTLASLFFGLGIWLLFRHHQTPALRYFGLRAFRFQTFFSLVFYPVFTLLGFEGDWAIIYDFGATPVWSGITAVSHAALLLLFWQGERRGWFEMVAYANAESQQAATQLASATGYNPQDQLRTVQILRHGGATNQAKTALRRLLAQHPDNGPAHLEMALLLSNGRRQPPPAALDNARKALNLGLSGQSAAVAHQLLGSYSLEVNRPEEAASYFSQALGALPDQEEHSAASRAYLHYLRSLAYRRLGQHELALEDMQQAVVAAGRTHDAELIASYQEVLADWQKPENGKRPFPTS